MFLERGCRIVHLICGLGETERQMVSAISRARKMGGSTHLFSFIPSRDQPWNLFLRLQLEAIDVYNLLDGLSIMT